MKKIDAIIVVEGKSDKQFLESFIDAMFLTCNGSAIDGFDVEYLKMLSLKKDIIILTDPDFPGMQIRNYLNEAIPNAKNAFIRKEVSIKHGKVGVAESTKEEMIKALENCITFKSNYEKTLKTIDLVQLNLTGYNSTDNKNKICEKYHLGKCNTKTMLNRLNMLGITRKELEDSLND